MVDGDSLFPLGVQSLQLSHALGEGFAAIHLQIPRVEADIVQEPLAALLVAKVFVVEITGIPIDKDTAEVEDNIL